MQDTRIKCAAMTAALMTALYLGAAGQAPRPGAVPTDNTFRNNMMLAKVLSRYRSMKTLAQKVHGKMTINADGVKFDSDIASTVQMAQPNRFRIDSEVSFFGDKKRGSVVSDGATVWDWDADAKQYAEQPLGGVAKDEDKFTDFLMDRGGLDLTTMFFLEAASAKSLGLPKGFDKAIDVKGFPTREVDGKPMYVVAVPVDKKSGKGTTGSATLYVDTADFLIRRLRYSVKPPAEKGGPKSISVDIVLFYDSIVTDKADSEADYKFNPPEGSTKADKVSPVFDRAFNK